MISRIAVLGVLVTLTCWLGQIGGCSSSGQDQNYKMLEEDRPMFDTRPDTNKPGASHAAPRTNAHVLATAPEPSQPAQVEIDRSELKGAGPVPVNNTPTSQGELQSAAPAAGDVEETDPATAKAVRDALAAAPPQGRSITGLDRSHWSAVTVGPDLSASYTVSYFKEADAHTNVWCLIAFERICFAAQVVALPVKMIITPPWTKTSSADKTCNQAIDSEHHHSTDANGVTCCETNGACCDTSSSIFQSAGPEAAPLKTGCSRGNHAGCVQCNCTGLKTTDKHTCASCCI